MENGNIREVVLGFKGIADNIPLQYDNFDEVFNSLFGLFHDTMNEMLPLKFFALCNDKFGMNVNVFDSEEYRDEWLINVASESTDSEAVYKKITFGEFVELAKSEWDDLSCYSCELDRVVVRI
ncbi:MAG: hypothetical protein NC299_17015 [Lachnospiraceae bacterium]|nr:hypothetical protein [Lachnospiraceae bacterium]